MLPTQDQGTARHDKSPSFGGFKMQSELYKENFNGSPVKMNMAQCNMLESPAFSQSSSVPSLSDMLESPELSQSSLVPALCPLLETPNSSGSTALSYGQAESLVLFSPAATPDSPTKSPTLLLNTKSLNHVRKLFTPPDSPRPTLHSSLETPLLPSNVVLSPQTKQNTSSLNSVSNTEEDLDVDLDVFLDVDLDALTQESSQNIHQQKLRHTPRAISQSIKRTGLLHGSPQANLQVMLTPKKNMSQGSRINYSMPKKYQGSPSTATITPSQSSPSKAGMGRWVRDKSMYRQYKGYYLANFIRIIDTVLSHPDDVKLLNDDDLAVVQTFRSLTFPAKKLYVRLFMRKIKWIRVSAIEYNDICDQEDTGLYIKELGCGNFLRTETSMTELEEVLPLLSVKELHGLCKQVKIPVTGKKENLISTLTKFTQKQEINKSTSLNEPSQDPDVLNRVKGLIGQCCKVSKEVHRVFMRILMLYGLPCFDDEEEAGQQFKLTTLLMVDMANMTFPNVEVNRQHSIFRSRDDLLRYETCSEILSDVLESMEAHRWDEAITHCARAKTMYQDLTADVKLMDYDKTLPSFLHGFTTISILIYTLTCAMECHQRLKDYASAVHQLRELLGQQTHMQNQRGHWFERLALNLDTHLKKPAEAVDAIQEALSDPKVQNGQRLSLSIRAQRMAALARHEALAPRIHNLPLMTPKEAPTVYIQRKSFPRDMPGYKRAFIRYNSAGRGFKGQVTACSVEALALDHYKDLGYSQGLNREGATINTLFGIYFWDAIYSPVPDVFRSLYQATPLDMDDPHFYLARKDWIDQRLLDMRSWSEEQAGVELARIWIKHHGKVSLVAWSLFRGIDHAKSLVWSLGMPVLSSICERLAKHHRFTRSGFPDLIVWQPSQKKCRIVEVKGPNDRLSTKQILWLEFLLGIGANAEVCHVEDIGAKNRKKVSRKKTIPAKPAAKKASLTKKPSAKTAGPRATSRKRNFSETEDEVSEGEEEETADGGQKGRRNMIEADEVMERRSSGRKRKSVNYSEEPTVYL